MEKEKTERSMKKYIPLYIATGICQVCTFIYLGIMPFLYTEFGIDTITFGYVMSAASFVTLCGTPMLGRLADSIGSRTVLILCMVSASTAHLVMGIAWSVPVLIFSRFCGVFMDCLPVSQMAVTDMTPEADRSYYLGKLMIPMSIALILGPPTSGFLSSRIGNQTTTLITWMLPLGAIVLILMFIPNKKKDEGVPKTDKKSGIDWSKLRSLILIGDIPYLLIMRFLTAFPAMLFLANFQIAGVKVFKLDAQGLGLVGASTGIMNLLNGMFILSFLTSRFNPSQLMKIGTGLNVLTYLGLIYASEVWHLIAVMCLVVISYTCLDNNLTALFSKAVDPKDSSTMLGISTAILQLCRTLSPTIGGALMQNYGFYMIGVVSMAVSLLSVTLPYLKSETKTKTS